jgi:hypothetical protein
MILANCQCDYNKRVLITSPHVLPVNCMGDPSGSHITHTHLGQGCPLGVRLGPPSLEHTGQPAAQSLQRVVHESAAQPSLSGCYNACSAQVCGMLVVFN